MTDPMTDDPLAPYPVVEHAQALPSFARHMQAALDGTLADPLELAAQLAWRDAQIAHLTQALQGRQRRASQAPPAPTFQVAINTYKESCGLSYLVSLIRPDRPADAKPWEPGVWTLSQTASKEQAEQEARDLQRFMDLSIPLEQLED